MRKLIALAATVLGAAILTVALSTSLASAQRGSGADAVVLAAGKGDLIRFRRKVSSVFLANPNVADVQIKSPRLVYIFGKNVGETTLFAVDDDDRVIARKTIRTTHNLKALRSAVDALEPQNAISIETVDQSLVIKGTVASGEMAADIQNLAERFVGDPNEIINRISVEGPTQVNLRVRIAEVQRSIAKKLGVDFDATLASGDFLFTFSQALAPGTDTLSGAVSGTSGDFSIDSVLDILSSEGLVRILAEPNLTAMSGETATFLAGGEFPFPIEDDEGNTIIQFEEFGVSLAFTPTILGEDRISIKVAPEVSELDFANGVNVGGTRVPGITTRRASTTVELGSGQSFVIAGLLQQTQNQSFDKLPGLGEVPVLGALFRSENFESDQTELVIIVTPYAVEPSSTELAAPTDGLLPPNDIDRLIFGRTYGKNASQRMDPKGRTEAPDLAGSAGFMLE